MESVQKPEDILMPPGYEFAPNVDFLQLRSPGITIFRREKNVLTVPGGRVKDGIIFIELPEEVKYSSKKYMFVVKTIPTEPKLPIEFYTKVFVTTE